MVPTPVISRVIYFHLNMIFRYSEYLLWRVVIVIKCYKPFSANYMRPRLFFFQSFFSLTGPWGPGTPGAPFFAARIPLFARPLGGERHLHCGTWIRAREPWVTPKRWDCYGMKNGFKKMEDMDISWILFEGEQTWMIYGWCLKNDFIGAPKSSKSADCINGKNNGLG